MCESTWLAIEIFIVVVVVVVSTMRISKREREERKWSKRQKEDEIILLMRCVCDDDGPRRCCRLIRMLLRDGDEYHCRESTTNATHGEKFQRNVYWWRARYVDDSVEILSNAFWKSAVRKHLVRRVFALLNLHSEYSRWTDFDQTAFYTLETAVSIFAVFSAAVWSVW